LPLRAPRWWQETCKSGGERNAFVNNFHSVCIYKPRSELLKIFSSPRARSRIVIGAEVQYIIRLLSPHCTRINTPHYTERERENSTKAIKPCLSPSLVLLSENDFSHFIRGCIHTWVRAVRITNAPKLRRRR
jgi:hypothetical protein